MHLVFASGVHNIEHSRTLQAQASKSNAVHCHENDILVIVFNYVVVWGILLCNYNDLNSSHVRQQINQNILDLWTCQLSNGWEDHMNLKGQQLFKHIFLEQVLNYIQSKADVSLSSFRCESVCWSCRCECVRGWFGS